MIYSTFHKKHLNLLMKVNPMLNLTFSFFEILKSLQTLLTTDTPFFYFMHLLY